MAKIKLTKSAVDAAQPQAQPVELRDTLVPGFLCKITPTGRKVFMLQYRTNAGERRKPALGLYGELTVEQARSLAQEWLAQVRRGGDPAAEKAAARQAPTVRELCVKFMEDHSSQRNKPSTQKGYQGVIDRNIIPLLGRMKVHDVKRPDVASMMKKMAHKPADANRTFSVMRKMFNLAEVWGYRPDGTNPCRHVPMYPNGKATHLISDEEMGKLFHYLDYLETEGLEHPVIPLAIRLQFEFAARRSEIVLLEWSWVDLENRPPGHRIPVLSGREKMQGKIKGRGTTLREKRVCTWGERGTRPVAAPCRVVSQYLVGIELSPCFSRSATLVLDGGAI